MDKLNQFKESISQEKRIATELKASEDAKFSKLKESVASLTNDGNTATVQDLQSLASQLFYYIDDLRSQVYSMSDRLWQHQEKGHLPPLDGGALSKLIKVAGMEDTYEVQKRVIYASADGKLKASIDK